MIAPNNETNQSENLSLRALAASIAAVKRTLIGFPFEYPLISLSTLSQANPALSPIALFRTKIREGSLISLYRGCPPYLLRVYLRSAFHATGITYLRDFYDKKLSKTKFQNTDDIKNILSACTMTTISNIVVNPLDRIRVYLLTRDSKIESIYYSSLSDALKEMNRGFISNYYRSALSWSIFLVAEERVRLWLSTGVLFKNNSSAYLSLPNLLILGIAVGASDLIVTLPLEAITTQIQKAGSPYRNIYSASVYLFNEFGLKGFYSSTTTKLVQYIITTILSSYTLQAASDIQRTKNPFVFFKNCKPGEDSNNPPTIGQTDSSPKKPNSLA